MIEIKDKSLCCGCRACENICPQKCIEIYEDENGFMFPKVNEENCINCNLCNNVCPMLNNQLEEVKEAYVVYSKTNNRQIGSSGGLFPEFAEYLLKEKGIVYGAGFDSNLKLKCQSIDNFKDIEKLSKSKYLQSDMEDNYKKIEKKLKAGEKVLFVSTPCYCQALKNYLKKDYENLFIVDFVCHGVPNQKLFDDNLKWYLKKNIKVKKYDFRENEHKINCSRVFRIESENQIIKNVFLNDPYYYYYYYCTYFISLRESCYTCPFAQRKRCTDITIGDFHNVKALNKEEERLKGFSSILINSDKGKKLFEKIKENLEIINLDKEKIIKSNAALNKPTTKPKRTEQFRKDYISLSYEELMKKYGFYSFKTRIKRIYYISPKFIQNIVRKILIKGEI